MQIKGIPMLHDYLDSVTRVIYKTVNTKKSILYDYLDSVTRVIYKTVNGTKA